MGMNTPWGRADHQVKLAEGVYSVDTPGHGGVMVRCDIARDTLSEPAQQLGMLYGQYLCYEEDCDWAIPAYEHPEWLVRVMAGNAEDIRVAARRTLRWGHEHYLVERGDDADIPRCAGCGKILDTRQLHVYPKSRDPQRQYCCDGSCLNAEEK